jgi:N-acetyl-gamma-glutamyl-phosphate reductase
MPDIRAGIVGAAGYTGGELIRLLLQHPRAELAFAHSRSNAGRPLAEVHPDLFGDTDETFAGDIVPDIDVLFLCLAHGDAAGFLAGTRLDPRTVIIDLSRDFRLDTHVHTETRNFVYGLPELQRDAIAHADAIANPGCFATAVTLALLPLASAGLLRGDVHVNATTGSTGAGRAASDTAHFSWRHANLAAYKPFAHEHLPEIRQSIGLLQAAWNGDLLFVPQRGAFTRGIHAACTLRIDVPQTEIEDHYVRFCAPHPFMHLSPAPVDVKQVVNTNKCLLHLARAGDALLVTSVLDNLLKGASGQAVQNMNLRFGFDERDGLRLKGSAY